MFEILKPYLIIIIFLNNTVNTNSENDFKKPNFTKLASQFGKTAEEFDVITEDKYILKLFRIPGDTNRPILLMHGLFDSADTFLLRGNVSLAITLSNAGYDVWAGNVRGNRYSRQHVTLDPDTDKKFWDFSIHEHGIYDLSSIIDFIFNTTGGHKMSAIGHSQGNAIFYILGSMKPEYNEKINIFVALAPVCFMHNMKRASMKPVFDSANLLNGVHLALNIEEVMGEGTMLKKLFNLVCNEDVLSYEFCLRSVIHALDGPDPEEFPPSIYKIIFKYFPTGTSRKNLVHYLQNGNSGNFSQFDYGSVQNLRIYNATSPPAYDLRKVTMRIAFFAAQNDKLSNINDVRELVERFPNVVKFHVMERESFNHIDYVWAKNVDKILYPQLFQTLSDYT